MADEITIENFAATMPKWDPESDKQRYAVVDMGSNGIRFSVTSLAPPHTRLLKCLYRERVPISLFDVLSSSTDKIIPPEIITAVTDALKRFLRISEAHDVPLAHISVFATEAMRKAANSTDMINTIHEETGLKIHVLSGMVETLFGAAGARSAFADLKGLVLDLGGGSLQMTWLDSTSGTGIAGEGEGLMTGDDEKRIADAGPESVELEGYEVAAARAGQSIPFGAARMTGILSTEDEVSISNAKADLGSQMAKIFKTLTEEFPVLRKLVEEGSEGIDLYLCGGGFRGYGNMLMHNQSLGDVSYPISSIGSYAVSGEEFSKPGQMLKLHHESEKKIFGLSKRRRTQFPAVIAVVDALLEALGTTKIRSVHFCAGSNREGALFVMLPREVREANPLPLVTLKDSAEDMEVTAEVVKILQSALPEELVKEGRVPTIFSLGLGPLFAQTLWSRPGGDAEYNAAAALHEAIAGEDMPGMTHVVKSVLALTTAARWQVKRAKDLAPVEKQLWKGLKKVIGREAYFWCLFIGVVADCFSTVVPAWPKGSLEGAVRFSSSVENKKKNDKVELVMEVKKDNMVGLTERAFEAAFKQVDIDHRGEDESGEVEERGKKVELTVKVT